MPAKGLPQFTGRGFLISKGAEVAYSNSGTPYIRLPLAFSKRVKNESTDEWETKNEVIIQAVAFGGLAEYLGSDIPEGNHCEIDVVGELYFETYENKDGDEVPQVKATLSAAGVVPSRDNNSSGGRSKSKSKPKSKPKQDDPWADAGASNDPWANDDEPPF